MTEERRQPEDRVEDLEPPREDSQQVTGGVHVAAGDVNADGVTVDPNNPNAPSARRLPSLHKAGDVTLKRG